MNSNYLKLKKKNEFVKQKKLIGTYELPVWSSHILFCEYIIIIIIFVTLLGGAVSPKRKKPKNNGIETL